MFRGGPGVHTPGPGIWGRGGGGGISQPETVCSLSNGFGSPFPAALAQACVGVLACSAAMAIGYWQWHSPACTHWPQGPTPSGGEHVAADVQCFSCVCAHVPLCVCVPMCVFVCVRACVCGDSSSPFPPTWTSTRSTPTPMARRLCSQPTWRTCCTTRPARASTSSRAPSTRPRCKGPGVLAAPPPMSAPTLSCDKGSTVVQTSNGECARAGAHLRP